MTENNLVEMTAIRKRQVIGEIIYNTELCCLVWKETGQPGQYTATTGTNNLIFGNREYTFYISRINSAIYLDVLANCKRFVTYNSSSLPDVAVLYQTIEGISDRRTDSIGEAIQNLQNVPPQCGILFTEYTRGGVVVGGSLEESWINKAREGGVVVGGHAPYEQTEFPEGGAILGGEAKVNQIVEFPEGGIIVGGETFADILISVGGGVVAGGQILFENTVPTSGGTVVGETAEYNSEYNIVGSGGVVANSNKYIWASVNGLKYTNTGPTLNTFKTTDIKSFTLNQDNQNIFWSDGVNIHKTSQFDPDDDVIIYTSVLSSSASIASSLVGMDYDGGLLVFVDGGDIIITDEIGTVISAFDYFGVVNAVAIDSTNNFLIVLQNFGFGFGGSKIVKYDLSTFTEIASAPDPRIDGGSDRLTIDRESELIFYGRSAGTDQAQLRIYKTDYGFTSETIVLPAGLSGGSTYDFDTDSNTKELFVWYKVGLQNLIEKMDYNGSNKTVIVPDVDTSFGLQSWLKINSKNNTAIIEYVPA